MDASTLLSVQLGGILGRDKYTRDPDVIAAKIAELRAHAGVHVDLLNREVGSWVGFYDSDETRPLVTALLAEFPGAVPWLTVGRERRGKPMHGTYEIR